MKSFALACMLFPVMLFFTTCKKEKQPETPQYPAILNLQGDFKPIAGIGMNITAAKDRYSVAYRAVATEGTVEVLGLDVALDSRNFIPAKFALVAGVPDPFYTSAFGFDAQRGLNISVTSYSSGGNHVLLIKSQAPHSGIHASTSIVVAERVMVSRVAAVTGGYLICGAVESGGSRDVFVMKINTFFGEEWRKTFAAPANDMAMDATELCDNTIGVLAYTYSYGQGDRDVWFMKLDNSNGDTILTKTFGGAGYEEPQQIIRASDCNLIIAGHSASFGHPEHHGYLLKIDDDGNKVWEKTYGTTHHDGFMAVTLMPGGQGILAAGRSMPGMAQPEDIFVQAVDLQGNALWHKIYGDPLLNENPVSILADEKYYYLLCNRDSAGSNNSLVFIKDLLQ